MDSFKSAVERAIEERKRAGVFFPAGTRNDAATCERCGQPRWPVPAVCWGQAVEGYQMLDRHDHGDDHQPLPGQGLSTEVRTRADFVALVHGRPCFLTADEKERYVEAAARGAKVIEIRGYVFDRAYPILPFEEWEAEERKRGREVDDGILD